jgi:putative transposase
MYFVPDEIYHVYNRGNQKQLLFKRRENYLYFLKKINEIIKPRCNILCWCLMPNHFHLLVHATGESAHLIPGKPIPMQVLSEGIRILLSSYTKGFNKEYRLCGNLFQQKTKAKQVSGITTDYSLTAFHYIHQNPIHAGLVDKMEDWEFSSFADYIGIRKGKPCNPVSDTLEVSDTYVPNLCNIPLAYELLDLNAKMLYKESYSIISPAKQKHIM